jgi:hypothetical protein
MKAVMVAASRGRRKNMTQLITRFQTEALEDAALQSKFANLQAILFRTQREQGERLQALASLETVEAEMNRRRARSPRLAP